MSRVIAQPVGQKRLTNIAAVRYKKMGIRFELACYKNKVVNWRNGIEKDLDEVVQTTTIFSNVSKGILAKHEDLQKVFGTMDEDKICRIILAEGELQVSDKERKLHYDSLFKDIAGVLVAKCVNADTNRPYTISMLERSLHDIHFAVDPKRPAKQQALEAIPELQKVIPVRRARMRLKLQVPSSAERELEQLLRKEDAVIENQSAMQAQVTVVCLVEPGCYREVHAFTQSVPGGRVNVLSLAATEESDASTEFEAAFANRMHVSPTRDAAVAGAVPDGAAAPTATTSSGFAAVSSAGSSRPRDNLPPGSSAGTITIYEGSVAGIPDEHASRRERFAELDELQPGWVVKLSTKADGGTVDATFTSPGGSAVGSYVAARRAALAAKKQAVTEEQQGTGHHHGIAVA